METGRKIVVETVVGGAAIEVRAFRLSWDGGCGPLRVFRGWAVPRVVRFFLKGIVLQGAARCYVVPHGAALLGGSPHGAALLRVALHGAAHCSYSVYDVPMSVGFVRSFFSFVSR